jgi:hypothetical protein
MTFASSERAVELKSLTSAADVTFAIVFHLASSTFCAYVGRFLREAPSSHRHTRSRFYSQLPVYEDETYNNEKDKGRYVEQTIKVNDRVQSRSGREVAIWIHACLGRGQPLGK